MKGRLLAVLYALRTISVDEVLRQNLFVHVFIEAVTF
jgi:hypothetical protein